MSEEIKDGEILDLMEKTGIKLNQDKDKQRLLISIYNTLRLIKNADKHPILHICPDCKKQTMENARTKAKEFGVQITETTNQTVNLTEDLSMSSK